MFWLNKNGNNRYFTVTPRKCQFFKLNAEANISFSRVLFISTRFSLANYFSPVESSAIERYFQRLHFLHLAETKYISQITKSHLQTSKFSNGIQCDSAKGSAFEKMVLIGIAIDLDFYCKIFSLTLSTSLAHLRRKGAKIIY